MKPSFFPFGIMTSACCASLFLLSPLSGEESLLNTSMTPREREIIGIDRLNTQQKKAFEEWLENWTRTTIAHAPSYHPSLSLSEWASLWKNEQHRQAAPNQENPEAALHTIFRNKNGEKLEFADGSVWDIIILDQAIVRMWNRGDKCTIAPTKRDLTRPFTIVNVSRNEEAGAKLLKKPCPGGKRPEDSPSYFAGSHPIKSIGINGEVVTLANGTVWNVAPLDQEHVLTMWSIHDRIRATQHSDALYPVKLENLDVGDSVIAIGAK